jgi:hypothetical protein
MQLRFSEGVGAPHAEHFMFSSIIRKGPIKSAALKRLHLFYHMHAPFSDY